MMHGPFPKVLISADIEGVCGVVDWDETTLHEGDHEYFRKMMAQEVNAAVEGALAAGAKDIIVRDAHGSARNLLPDMVHPEAQLIRAWTRSPFSMMDGIDRGIDAVVFVGYHARAGTPHATLKHTMNGKIYHLKVNGQPVAEAEWNALIAGYFGVPVVFIAGDKAVCDYAKERFADIETVAVKEGLGKGVIGMHPSKAQALIRAGVEKAINRLGDFKPHILTAPYFVEIEFRREEDAYAGQWYPGAEVVNETTIGFRNEDFYECLRFFYFTHD
ncbi:MAG: hypothetical protein CO167_12790 [Candidatus Marinimicrobia bacterium CG_4_9_14_3_um_filter_48_9]|nr:MAG: hypothetical protein CO167_12790 [Candidatus Marinimicrobia bacterium CG_4_9_14_3_um_filter_48_9]